MVWSISFTAAENIRCPPGQANDLEPKIAKPFLGMAKAYGLVRPRFSFVCVSPCLRVSVLKFAAYALPPICAEASLIVKLGLTE